MENFIQMLNTKQKALEINLDTKIYGTFAEIGAGQEVARHFFQAGGAAGTIAKSISAYDMAMSDAIYGKEESGRYVCESRLAKMLDREFNLLLNRLSSTRASDTRFFAFANTVAARSFHSQNDGNGWIGVRFQHIAGAEATDVVIHVRMLDNQNLLQQEALGAIGVNLIYACYFYLSEPGLFIRSLMDNLTVERIEIDMIRVSGPGFESRDPRLLNLELIKRHYSSAVIFDEKGHVIQPTDALYKKDLLVLRGSFRPPTLVNLDMLAAGLERFQKDLSADEHKNIVVLPEISMSKLVERGEVDNSDFLARVDLLSALGQKVMISNKETFWGLNIYLKTMTKKRIAYVLGIYQLESLLDLEKYQNHPHGLLSAVGQSIGNQSKIYIYPAMDEKTKKLLKAKDCQVHEKVKGLLNYLIEVEQLIDVDKYHADYLCVWSRTVLKMIQNGESGWQSMVPEIIAKTVEKKGLFGFQSKK